MRFRFQTVWLFLFIIFLSPSYANELLVGQVIAVTDGDTLKILTPNKQQIKIRLAEIDTPESGQTYGRRSKEELSSLAFGKEAKVTVVDVDRYGRTVGRVFINNLDINAELVRRGAAWVYRKYAKDKSLYELENEAISMNVGIWALPESQRLPPWEWRNNRSASSNSNLVSPPARAGTCGSKRYCK